MQKPNDVTPASHGTRGRPRRAWSAAREPGASRPAGLGQPHLRLDQEPSGHDRRQGRAQGPGVRTRTTSRAGPPSTSRRRSSTPAANGSTWSARLMVGRTNQTDDLDSTELTPRLGLRLHLLSNLRQQIVKERHPKRRLVLRDLLRLEWRNLYDSTDKADSSTVRLRNRWRACGRSTARGSPTTA